jgi:hypothetical protein
LTRFQEKALRLSGPNLAQLTDSVTLSVSMSTISSITASRIILSHSSRYRCSSLARRLVEAMAVASAGESSRAVRGSLYLRGAERSEG